MTWGDAIGTKSSIFGLMKIGVVREGKVPPDQRVPLTPAQCADLKQLYPEVELVVESSDVRRIADDEYRQEGVEVVTSLEGCDVLLGVKEVPVDELIPDSTYLFFSHTTSSSPTTPNPSRHRGQAHQTHRLRTSSAPTARGHWVWSVAGIVGRTTLWAWGLRHKTFTLPGHDCADMKNGRGHNRAPEQMKICWTGGGRVGMGAHELGRPQLEVHSDAFGKRSTRPCSRIDVVTTARRDGGAFHMQGFIADPQDTRARS